MKLRSVHVYAVAWESSVLRQVTVPIVSQSDCKQYYDAYRLDAGKDGDFCAGYADGGKDSCGGDSGGPLMCMQGDVWYQHGIVSWGERECDLPDHPAVYTDVSYFLQWIQQQQAGQNKDVISSRLD